MASAVSASFALSVTGPCAVCGKDSEDVCSGCTSVFYCNSGHQRQHWRTHKNTCQRGAASTRSPTADVGHATSPASAALCAALHQETAKILPDKHLVAAAADECVGTFRWAPSARLSPLPAFPLVEQPSLADWKKYFASRFPDDGQNIVVEPIMMDALSYPLSLLYALFRGRVAMGPHMNIIVGGATARGLCARVCVRVCACTACVRNA
jgi:hypothetical protein